jgi:hypothetical protein
MRINVKQINQSILDYTTTNLNHNNEITKTLENLQLDLKKL